jgi:hypothetical protein
MRWGLVLCAALLGCTSGPITPVAAASAKAQATPAAPSALDAGSLMDDPRLYDKPY